MSCFVSICFRSNNRVCISSQFGGIILCLNSADDGNHTYFNKGLWKLSLQNYYGISWVNFNKDGRLLDEVILHFCRDVILYQLPCSSVEKISNNLPFLSIVVLFVLFDAYRLVTRWAPTPDKTTESSVAYVFFTGIIRPALKTVLKQSV